MENNRFGLNEIYKMIMTAGLSFVVIISVHTCSLLENISDDVTEIKMKNMEQDMKFIENEQIRLDIKERLRELEKKETNKK